MASYRERSEQKAAELSETFADGAVPAARHRIAFALEEGDIEQTFLWLDVSAVLEKRAPW